MPHCPRCSQPVDASAIACPHCQIPLKAYGHPGIPLHRSQGEEYLCTTCLYHEDDTCNFPQRPFAQDCTLYHDRSEPILPLSSQYISGGWPQLVKSWCQRNIFWLFLLGLVIVSLLLSL
ncbi:zinc ribbon domain-containing protein [Kamptonema animale CS-326]|uniref:zinc ribbon domain-containing protein n=1 Tax=Kamptonema animale TaxID=92934 RepID=UPI002330F1ED|nr:zinc ribbon domain-containing protein [Kamptonema animale]MDB9511869.1 zinc ribbon domain-containing protein [Kamptonema animale CS-326]